MNAAPSPEAEREEIVADARRERRLIPQAVLALVVVVVVVVVRELFLR
ncbi:hypothetical protein ACNPM4_19095 [Microbacterium sp. AGC62]|jgi:hypothetical protein|nr:MULTISPECIES: hypothetical protein [Microbacterium]NJI60554.1 hypothetical protein [Microbacterium sp. B19(2022)]